MAPGPERTADEALAGEKAYPGASGGAAFGDDEEQEAEPEEEQSGYYEDAPAEAKAAASELAKEVDRDGDDGWAPQAPPPPVRGATPAAKPAPAKKMKARRRAAKLDTVTVGDVGIPPADPGLLGAGDSAGGLGHRGEGGGFRTSTTRTGAKREREVSVNGELEDKDAIDLTAALGGKQGNKRGDGRFELAQELKSELDRRQAGETEPTSFLPRKLYFENSYLGGNAAYEARLHRLEEALAGTTHPYLMAEAYAQQFDPPPEAGLSVTASLDRRWIERPGRVYLQVGLQGSQRYGWRRPPLDLVLVLDAAGLGRASDVAVEAIATLLRRLGPQDRLGVIWADTEPRVLADMGRIRQLRATLPPQLENLLPSRGVGSGSLLAGLRKAGAILHAASEEEASIPGTRTVLLLTAGSDAARVEAAERGAHELTVQGVVSSVIEVGAVSTRAWWPVANAGHGNYHRTGGGELGDAIGAELDSLSRVVARLIRVNIRLGKHARAVRILGSRVLDEDEVVAVKAREKAIDQNLSKTLGVTADRGDDDDGIQTVIPYFYGGDSHVIIVELWVEEPGPVADVTVRYKDMVRLDNATARDSVALGRLPRDPTPVQLTVRRNIRGFSIAENLQRAALRVRHGDTGGALAYLNRSRALTTATTEADALMLERFSELVRGSNLNDYDRRASVADALMVASDRKIGQPPSSAQSGSD